MPAKGSHHSEEFKAKLSELYKGRVFSPETIEKMRVAQAGRKRGPHSPETRERIAAAQRGRKKSPEQVEKNRLSHIGLPGTRNGAVLTDETKQKIREARALQVHPGFARRGITLAMVEEATSKGLRWCSGKCKAFVPAEKFYGDINKAGGGWCGECINSNGTLLRAKWTPEQKTEFNEYLVKYRQDNPERVRANYLKSHYGVTPQWYDAKLAEQGGHCALCDAVVDARKMPENCTAKERKYLLVDHDHETGVARGLLCAKCNTALHRVEYIKDWATKALAYLAQYSSDVLDKE